MVASAEVGYASEVRSRVKAACPSAVILEQHLGPDEMAAVFNRTYINVHPCAYDAYGMSIVEAAAFGAPSLVNKNGIGALALLKEACFDLNLEGDGAAAVAAYFLSDAGTLRQGYERSRGHNAVAAIAKERALGWDEAAAGRSLFSSIEKMTAAGAQ